jgi:hypothetical protein
VTSGATIDASSVQSDSWFVPSDATIEVAGDATIVGPVELAGRLELDGTATLEIDALDAIDTSTISIAVPSAPSQPRLTIADAGLAGEIVVDLGGELPDPTDVLLIATATPPTGTPTLTLTGVAAGARLVARRRRDPTGAQHPLVADRRHPRSHVGRRGRCGRAARGGAAVAGAEQRTGPVPDRPHGGRQHRRDR